MSDLKTLCKAAGFSEIRTYIASGNVVFESGASEQAVKSSLERRLAGYAGHPVGVIVRTAAEMTTVLECNPFPRAAPNRTVAIFLDHAPPLDTLAKVTGRTVEDTCVGKREIYVHYEAGIAGSKLKIAAAQTGTARNMNTIAKLVALAKG